MYETNESRLLSSEDLANAQLPLKSAFSLPPAAYTCPALFERETDRVLRREWLCIGRTDQVENAGDYFTLDLLGEKLVVTRDKAGEVRALSRICVHRAAEIVSGSGNAASLRCPYHSWTYALDGALLGAPLMERAEGFDKSKCGLPRLRTEIWEGWIFVNFDPDADALGPQIAPLTSMLANYRMADMITTEPLTFDSGFNWKVLVDNFMEAYHHIAIHRDVLEPLFPARLSHVPDNEGPYSVLVMPTGGDTPAPPIANLPAHGKLEDWQDRSLVAAVVFPFHLFSPGHSSLIWYQLIPETVDRFVLQVHLCFPRGTLENPEFAEGIAAFRDISRMIHEQDIVACDAVWSGLNARSFRPGRLNPLERSIWQFNQWWITRMTAD